MSSAPRLEPKKPPSSRVIVRSQQPHAAQASSAKSIADLARDAGITVALLRQGNPQLRAFNDAQGLSQGVIESIQYPKSASRPGQDSPSAKDEQRTPTAATAATVGASPKALSSGVSGRQGSMMASSGRLPRPSPPSMESVVSPTGLMSSSTGERKEGDTASSPPPRGETGSPRAFAGASSWRMPGQATTAAAAPPIERPTVRGLAIKHEFSVDEVVRANPALAHLELDDPLPSGTKVNLPKRTRPKFSTVQANCVADEVTARQAILTSFDEEVVALEATHDDTMLTLHLLHEATHKRRDLLLADVITDARMDFVGLDGGDTADRDFLSADEETRAMLVRIEQVALAADRAHWSAAAQGPSKAPTTVTPPSTEKDAAGLTPLSGALCEVTSEMTMSQVAEEPIASLNSTARGVAAPSPATAAPGPWAAVMLTLQQEVQAAVQAERRALLEGNFTTLRALVVRRAKLAVVERRLDSRFDDLHKLREALRRRERAVQSAEAFAALREGEANARSALGFEEGAARHDIVAHHVAATLKTIHEVHSLRWNHQVRMAAAATAQHQTLSPGTVHRRGGPAVVRRQQSVASHPDATTDGVQYIVIGADDTPTASQNGSPRREEAANADEPTATPVEISAASSFQLDHDQGDESSHGPAVTDSLAEGGSRTSQAAPASRGEATSNPRRPGEPLTAVPDQHDETPTDFGVTPLPHHQDDGDGDGTTAEMGDLSEVSTAPTTGHGYTAAARSDKSRPAASAEASSRLRSPAAAVAPRESVMTWSPAAAEQHSSAAAAVPRPVRDPMCLWDYLPACVFGAGAKTLFDEYDLLLKGDAAMHVGMTLTSRGRALLRAPLAPPPRHRGALPGATVLKFHFDLATTMKEDVRSDDPDKLPQIGAAGLVRSQGTRGVTDAARTSARKTPGRRGAAAPQSSLQLYAVVPEGGGFASAHPDLRLDFDSPDCLVPAGASLVMVARCTVPAVGGTFQLLVDLNARSLQLRSADDGLMASRDGLWAAESVGAAHDQLVVGVTLAGQGSRVMVL